MSDNKKYYYLKLKENFYESEEMIILQNMTDGYLYSDILMKLYLRSLKTEGKLMFKNIIPYTPTVLAQVVRHQVGTIERALKIFQELGLVEILDNGAIYMTDIQNFIGESSTEADRIRNYRKRIKQEELSCTNVQLLNDKNTPEIELEKEIDIELEKEAEVEAEKKVQMLQSNSDNKRKPLQVQQLFNYIKLKGFELSDTSKMNLIKFIAEGRKCELVKYAVDEAIENKAQKWSYVEAILNRYKFEDYKTVEEVILAKQKKQQDKLPRYSTRQLESFYAN